MKKNQGPNEFESIGMPIIDLFIELPLVLIDLFINLLSNVSFGSSKKRKKLEMRELDRKAKAMTSSDLGYSLSSKSLVKYTDLYFKSHNLIVGASQYGKSNLMLGLAENSFANARPFFFINPKNDLKTLMTLKEMAKTYEHPFYVFSKSYKGPESINLNPVKEGDIVSVADRIFKVFSWSEEHYKQQCYRALKEAIKALRERGQVLDLGVISAELIDIESSQKRREHLRLSKGEINGIINRLTNFTESEYGNLLKDISGRTKTFKEIWKEGGSVYIDLPVMQYGELTSALGKMLLAEMCYAVSTIYETSIKTTYPMDVFVDELGNFITPDFIDLVNKGLGAGIRMSFGFQDDADIKQVKKEYIDQLYQNSTNWFFFNQATHNSASNISNHLGTVDSSKETSMTIDGAKGDRGSTREVREFRVHPDLIKNLSVGQCVAQRRLPHPVVETIQTRLVDIEVSESPVIPTHRIHLKDKGAL